MSTVVADWVPHGPKVQLVRVGLDPSATINDFAQLPHAQDWDAMVWAYAELLPLFAARFGVDDGRILGLRRRNFYVNAIALNRINDAVDALKEAGIASVLGGGLAAMTAYPDSSYRSLPDAELIVPAADHERAKATLISKGWTSDELDRLGREPEAMLKLTPRLRGTVAGFVVHTDEIDTTINSITGRSLPMIAPAIAVVETAVAAVWPMADPPIRWVVDLNLLLTIDGSKAHVDAIVRHARAHGAAHLLRVALQLAQRLGVRSVPPRLLRKLAMVRVNAFERDAVMQRTGVSRRRFGKDRLSAIFDINGGGS